MAETNGREKLPGSYHLALPLWIRDYLNRRGITDPIIERHLLGWNGKRITIPIYNREGAFSFFRLSKDPEDKSAGPKMLSEPGSSAELYGWEWLNIKPSRLMICEGEYDRLLLERHGIPAVTSTGGAGVFKRGWAEAFTPIREVYVCFDHDTAGQDGAQHVGHLITHARIVELPDEVGQGGDITDFLIKLGKSQADFECLLRDAKPVPKKKPPTRRLRKPSRQQSGDDEIAKLKASVSIEDIVQRYVHLRGNGRYLTACCPFHEDRSPSFVVYTETQSFYCFGCREHGDVLDFLMKIEGLTFPEAVETLKEIAR